MRDPVKAADGWSYERSAIAEWLGRRRCSPLTNCPVDSALLVPNEALRRRIDRWARQAAEPPPAAAAASTTVSCLGAAAAAAASDRE